MSNFQMTSFKVYSKYNRYCQLDLKISEEIIEDQSYYILKMDSKYEDNSFPQDNHPDNPFKNYNLNKQIFGELIYKNDLTEKAVNFLMMDMNELSKHTGRTTPLSYKLSLIVFLSNLWD